ncbi:hypothetical protein [Fictibacillus gelatini]|uniref:hypothetical protein n=1 Tax=Fictibacillus gelatini TaxID=225985 RepID=UPI00041CBEA4|nr:hypothetical protein [Fictibacillus gelatini]
MSLKQNYISDKELKGIECHFLALKQQLGDLADENQLNMVFRLIRSLKAYQGEIERLTTLNRHYFFKLYKNLEAGMIDNKYILEGEKTDAN